MKHPKPRPIRIFANGYVTLHPMVPVKEMRRLEAWLKKAIAWKSEREAKVRKAVR